MPMAPSLINHVVVKIWFKETITIMPITNRSVGSINEPLLHPLDKYRYFVTGKNPVRIKQKSGSLILV